MKSIIPKFSLWLEFEEFDLSEQAYRPEENFANIKVIIEDGRQYALNIWTFDFFPHARKEWPYDQNSPSEESKYMLPPDLFVEKLDRMTIDQVVKELLAKDEMKEEWLCSEETEWKSFSHHDKYCYLEKIRHNFCVMNRKSDDISGETYVLNGKYILDIPSFYLALGEAVNGYNGYYGACLDSLSDCFCGGFGAKPPFTIQILKAKHLPSNLDERAWLRFVLERQLRLFEENYNLSLEELKELGIGNSIELSDKSYLTALMSLFHENNINFELCM